MRDERDGEGTPVWRVEAVRMVSQTLKNEATRAEGVKKEFVAAKAE